MRPPALRIHAEEILADSFAGGGGASTGLEWATGRSPDFAINHDAKAIAMHQANHPDTHHFCEDVFKVNPRDVVGSRRIALAWFSPDCTYFSKARGAKPFRDPDGARRRRGLAGVVIRWAALPKLRKPRVIIMENVEEFEDWGPLDENGLPDPLRAGLSFRRWLAQLRNRGYEVQYRQLVASDYGAPTRRKRLFVIARSDGRPIVWPKPTHGPGLLTPRAAAECIDFALPVHSIFLTKEEARRVGVKRPLADKTMARIGRGVWRYVINAAEPFIIPVTHGGDLRSHPVSEPMRTITGAHRGEHALVEPFLFRTAHGERDATGKKRGRGEHSIEEPLPTVTASSIDFALAAPYLARLGQYGGNGKYVNDVREPLTTATTKAEHLLVSPSLIQARYGERPRQAPRCLDIQEPLGTVVGGGRKHALVAEFLARHYGGHENDGAPLQQELPTITTRDHHALVALHLLKLRGDIADHPNTAQDIHEPFPTITTAGGRGGHLAEVRAFLIKYYGTDQDPQLGLPLSTVTTKDRFGLVTVHGEDYAIADIGMRMLVPRELFNAQSFPPEYQIDVLCNGKPLTKGDQVELCGNAVPPKMGEVLAAANLSDNPEGIEDAS